MGPKTLILVVTIVGFFIWGLPGAVGGFVVGFGLALAFGQIVRKSQGGLMPRNVRHSLVTNVLADHGKVVGEAFPDLHGLDLFRAVEAAFEEVARKSAATTFPNEAAWNDRAILGAALDLVGQQQDEALISFYHCVYRQLARDWYGHPFA